MEQKIIQAVTRELSERCSNIERLSERTAQFSNIPNLSLDKVFIEMMLTELENVQRLTLILSELFGLNDDFEPKRNDGLSSDEYKELESIFKQNREEERDNAPKTN